jgi:hypothetical protein
VADAGGNPTVDAGTYDVSVADVSIADVSMADVSMADVSVPDVVVLDEGVPEVIAPEAGASPCSGGAGGTGGGVGPTYPCGNGLSCVCPTEYFPPAPCNDAGQQVQIAYRPPPGPITPYSSMAEFNAMAVGRWQRVAAPGELQCEVFGVEITADNKIAPIAFAVDGTPQTVQLLAQPLGLFFDDAGTPMIQGNNPPVFYDAGSGPGSGMQLLLSPWLANYVKLH